MGQVILKKSISKRNLCRDINQDREMKRVKIGGKISVHLENTPEIFSELEATSNIIKSWKSKTQSQCFLV